MLFIWRVIAIFVFLSLFTEQQSFSFVFLGPNESRLKPSNGRDVYFLLTPQSPSFVDKESFENGVLSGKTDAEVFKILVEASMQYWNDIPNLSLSLKVDSSSGGKIDPADGIFSIGVSPISQIASGLAYPRVDDSDPATIKDCDIEVSTDVDSIASFIFVMTHELGHCLGLGHNHNDPTAIMGYWTPQGVLSLGLDDIAGALYLYPPAADGRVQNFAPCGNLALVNLSRSRLSQYRLSQPTTTLRNDMLASNAYLLLVLPVGVWFVTALRSLSFRRRRRKFVR